MKTLPVDPQTGAAWTLQSLKEKEPVTPREESPRFAGWRVDFPKLTLHSPGACLELPLGLSWV